MTPLQKAQAFLQDLIDRAEAQSPELILPTPRYAQIGTPGMPCASFIVAVTSMAPDEAEEGPVVCDASQLATFLIVWTQDCSWQSDESGVDDPVKVASASERMDVAGTFLWNWANELTPFLSKEWTVAWIVQADLGITTLTLTTGVD